MTDARAEMRKNVREIIARGYGCDRPCGDRMSVLDCGCLNDADAAIDSVLEEAAQICRYYAECSDNPMNFAGQCEEDIRALKNKTENAT